MDDKSKSQTPKPKSQENPNVKKGIFIAEWGGTSLSPGGDARGTRRRPCYIGGGEDGWNKGACRASYVMNGLSRRSRLIKQRGVIMASVVHPIARTRETHLNRNDIRQASRRKNLLSRGLMSLCERNRMRSGRRNSRRALRSRLAIRPGRFPSARAARATARRIGISVWRSDQWEVPVVVR